MSINFKRNRTQQKYESILGISSVEELVQNKQNFKRMCYQEKRLTN